MIRLIRAPFVMALASLALTGMFAASAKAVTLSNLAVRSLEPIAANDNHQPGGTLAQGRLHLALVARRGRWYPDGPRTLGLPIDAFGEVGRQLSIPGPLLRAPLGTRVEATVRNDLSHDLTIHGLGAPTIMTTSVLRVPRGETRRVSFVLDRPGMFGYYGTLHGESINTRIFDDAELSGAILVDAPHTPHVGEILVLGLYAPVRRKDGSPDFVYFLETINGRAFPATERLTYDRGARVRWGIFNASPWLHPMHLHGFYFRTARSDAYDEVTHPFRPGDAEVLSWTADRAGDWMFHCHIDDHISRHAPLSDMLAGKADPALTIAKRFHLPNEPMGGMVVAVTVLPRPGDAKPVVPGRARNLTLDVTDATVTDAPFGITRDAFMLTDGARTVPPTGALGPPIVLVQNQPVAIAVTNHMSEATSVHWHGISLQNSYDDGGAGMGMGSMSGGKAPPAIATGKTFVAHFTPPDAGTFMYHSHLDDGWQLAGGLAGPLIVVPKGRAFDPRSDHIVMVSESFKNAGGDPLAVNGFESPPPITATVGVPQRLRFSDLTLGGENLVVSLSEGNRVIRWIPIAKDGRDMPLRWQQFTAATHALSTGETRDFRFTPTHPGTLNIGVYDASANGILAGSQQIIVIAP